MSNLTYQRTLTEEQFKDELLKSFMCFLQYFFELKNGKPFKLSQPIGRQSHFLTIRDELEKVFNLETNRLIINVPPGYAKSTMLIYFTAWCIAHYPDSNFLYISYSFELAEKHTATIKEIITMPAFKHFFGVELRNDSKSRSNFKTTAGGITRAFGAGGSVTGQDGGLPNLDRFSGAVIIDDPIKPDDCHSETIRENVIRNYMETIKQRVRGPNVPILFIGQRLHEGDLAQFLLDGKDGSDWKHVVLKALDASGNALYPEVHNIEWLKKEEKFNRYVYWSQLQQQPIPDGGGIFEKDDFVLTDFEPNIISTFMTIDTAETNKDWNDATAMSFWGIYRIEARGIDTGLYGLHWLDCREIRVEPKDLEAEFFDFYASCMRYKVKPMHLAIEKASTGVTLSSILKETQGLKVLDVVRTKASGSKTARFYEAQPYVASKRVSFTKGAKHVDKCLEHIRKITSNDSHAHDDICFVANTKIATIYGEKNIQDVQVGDYVITPFGIDRVKDSRITNYHAQVITNIGLTGTRKHPIFTGREFTPLDAIENAVNISSLSLKDLIRWQYKKLLYSMESHIGLWDRNAIISVNAQQIKAGGILKDFMLQFGNFIVNKKFLKGMLFIIKMGIALITTLIIWNVYRMNNICRNINCPKLIMARVSKIKGILQKLSKPLKHGIEAIKVDSGIVSTPTRAFINLKNMFAKNAVKVIHALIPQKAITAMQIVGISNLGECNQLLQLNVPIAEKCLTQKEMLIQQGKENVAQEIAQQSSHGRIVYNLTIENHGVYYANGILVSNCDTMQMAIQCALIEGTLLPKVSDPTGIIKSMGDDFRANQFIQQKAMQWDY